MGGGGVVPLHVGVCKASMGSLGIYTSLCKAYTGKLPKPVGCSRLPRPKSEGGLGFSGFGV